MSEFITNSKEAANPFVHAGGDMKEAIDRTRESEARQLEMYTKRFNGDKEYAKRYMASKMRQASGR
ncbi:UNVERIFIED_ORG: hypothetical protein ABID57_000702 [Arthrobacter sp. UYEF1]